MAVYHTNLKYHEDDVEKVSLSKEDIEFLKELQKEMNTQDNCGTANPRYWGIKGVERIYHIEPSEADGFELYDSDGCDTVGETLEEVWEYIEENILPEVSENDGIEYKVVDNIGIFGNTKGISYIDEDGEEQILEDLEDIQEWLDEHGYSEYKLIYYKLVSKIYENAIFLTEKDACEHLKANAHHYDSTAHTYCLCGWRSPRFERLIKILSTTDFDEL